MVYTDPSKVLTLAQFLPYQLSILSNKVSGLIAQTYKDKFALSILEWRIMAVLGEDSGISADQVSAKTQIEKSIVSRSVNKLLSRKLLEREMAAEDKRRSVIKLSALGRTIYDEIVPISLQQEQALMACLSAEQQRQFIQMIERLYAHAEGLEQV